MGRKRKIFTKREYEKLSKTHEGRQKINSTYCAVAVFSCLCFIGLTIFGFANKYIEGVGIMGIIGTFISAIFVLIFSVCYVNENKAEQERIKNAQLEEQRRIELQIKETKEKAELERIRISKLKESNIEEIDKMDGYQFEEFVTSILSDFGYQASTTRKSGDFGVDIIMEKDGEKIIIQTKRYAKKVSVSAVQEVASAKNYYNIQTAWVVTNNYFTEPAKQLAQSNNIKLIDRDELINLIIEAKNIRQQKQSA